MTRLGLIVATLGALIGGAAPARAEAEPGQTAPAFVEDLVRNESLRARIETAIEGYAKGDVGDGAGAVEDSTDRLSAAVDGVLPLGHEMVPYLASELEFAATYRLYFIVYALGRVGGPEAVAALRASIAREDARPGGESTLRKAWSCWGLALAGDPESARLLLAGERPRASMVAIYRDTTALEAAFVLTAPASLPILVDQLRAGPPSPEAEPPPRSGSQRSFREAEPGPFDPRFFALRAARRVADPSLVEHIVPYFGQADESLRAEAARTLSTMNVPKAVEALVTALSDAAIAVRRNAANSLDLLAAPVDRAILEQRLDVETDAVTRGLLYRVLARAGGDAALDALLRYQGRENFQDRRELVSAIGRIESGRAFEALGAALHDSRSDVVFTAIGELVRRADSGATDLLIEVVRSSPLGAAAEAASALAHISATRSAPAIAERLTARELRQAVTGRAWFDPLRALAEALVDLRYTAVLPDLREAAARQTDASVRSRLMAVVPLLETLERNGPDLGAWAETAHGPEPALRRLAYERLAEIGSPEAAAQLAAAFPRVDPSEGRLILRALGEIDAPASIELITRVLTDPLFDAAERAPLRAMAAWAARRIGGRPMFDLLAAAARRREGRDPSVLVYAALLGGADALPLLDQFRVSRMHHLSVARGEEQERLDRLARHLRAGRPLTEWDQEPGRLAR